MASTSTAPAPARAEAASSSAPGRSPASSFLSKYGPAGPFGPVFQLIPGVQSYDWGKTADEGSLVAQFASATDELEFKSEAEKPYAEVSKSEGALGDDLTGQGGVAFRADLIHLLYPPHSSGWERIRRCPAASCRLRMRHGRLPLLMAAPPSTLASPRIFSDTRLSSVPALLHQQQAMAPPMGHRQAPQTARYPFSSRS